MEFGVPSKKRVKIEKHPDTAVLTLLPFEGENTSRKIEFNPKAYEVMGLTPDELNMVAFSFNRSDYTQNAIVNANAFNSEASLKISKNGKLSNKAHYEELKSRYGVSMEEELELTLVDSGNRYGEEIVFSLVTLKSVQDAEPNQDPVVEEEEIKPESSYDNAPSEEALPPMESYSSFENADEKEQDDMPWSENQ